MTQDTSQARDSSPRALGLLRALAPGVVLVASAFGAGFFSGAASQVWVFWGLLAALLCLLAPRWPHHSLLPIFCLASLVLLLAALWVPKYLQRRLIFQDSMHFFSETTKGRAYCFLSATVVFLSFAGFMSFETLYVLGYARIIPVQIFAC